jgi:hypothetical protein
MTLAVSARQQTQFTAARTLIVVSRSRPTIRGRVAPPGYQEGAGGAGLNHANGYFQHTCSLGSFAGQTVSLKIALLRQVPRTATVIAMSSLQARTLTRAEFLAAVTGNAASAEGADEVVSARLEDG